MQTVSDITAITPPSDPIDRPSSSNTEQISSDSTGPPLDTDLTTLDADLATLDAANSLELHQMATSLLRIME